MKIKQFFSIGLLVMSYTGLTSNTVFAATSSDELFLYSFQKTKPLTLDTSRKLMGNFLQHESTKDLTLTEDNIARYVSGKDVNTTFEHNLTTGDIRFQRNFSLYLGNFKPALPSADESLEIAKLFLTQNELLPQDSSSLKVAHIGGLRASTVTDDGKAGPIIDKLITLTYSREINGIPVIGPGSKYVVNIGEKGEIIGLTKQWRELYSEGIYLNPKEIYSEKEAIELATRSILREFGKEAGFEILNTQVSYFDNNGQYLQPVYAFQTKVKIADKNVAPFEYVSVVQAMRNPKENLQLTTMDKDAIENIQEGKGEMQIRKYQSTD